jgi:ABC-type branched-subunit amino acid transport system substrate-binding protein
MTENRVGIVRGAAAKHAAGVITTQQRDDIVSAVNAAQCYDFRPRLFVIPTAGVENLIFQPAAEDKAHPLSEEYVIKELPRSRFDVIEFGDAA